MIDLDVAIPVAVMCVLVSALCCGTEVALFSLRRVDREHLARSDSPGDRRIIRLLERPRKLIATVVIGNEACAGALAALAFDIALRFWSPWPAVGIALAVALPMAVLVMEVTAKTLAAKSPLAWARACSPLLVGFQGLVTPLRLVVTAISALLLRPFGDNVRARPVRDLSEAEFRKLVDAGSAQGQVDARERRLIHRVFEFSDKKVGQVMTPRDRIYALSFDLPMQRIAREVSARGFSRVPIYSKSLDNVRGIINAKDLVRAAGKQARLKPLGELLHEPLFVPRTTPVKRLFLTFKTKKVHMAIVVSEYGKVLGLVTMDDLLAQIFGVLRDERAALQDSITPSQRKARTPAGGVTGSSGGNGAGGDDRGFVSGSQQSRAPGPLGRPDTGPIVRVEPGEAMGGSASTPARESSYESSYEASVGSSAARSSGEAGREVPGVVAAGDPGVVIAPPVPIETFVPLGDATGPVRLEDATGPVRRSDLDVETAQDERDAGTSNEALDPPPRSRHLDRPTHPDLESELHGGDSGSAGRSWREVDVHALAAAEPIVGGVPPGLPIGLRPSAEHAIPIFPADELTPPAVDPRDLEPGDGDREREAAAEAELDAGRDTPTPQRRQR